MNALSNTKKLLINDTTEVNNNESDTGDIASQIYMSLTSVVETNDVVEGNEVSLITNSSSAHTRSRRQTPPDANERHRH